VKKDGDKPIANPCIVLREEFDDWAILFNPNSGRGFGLSPTGVCVWKLLDGEHTVDELLEKVQIYADYVPEEARDHVTVFIDELAAEGLAGCDLVGCGPKKSSCRPSEPLSEVKPFRYEPPKLIDFVRESMEAQGAQCFATGAGACGGCLGTGSHPSVNCTNGASKCDCLTGTSNTTQCACGTSPGTTNFCGSGNCDYVTCGTGTGATCHTGAST